VAGDYRGTLALPFNMRTTLLVNESLIVVELSLNAILKLLKHLGQCFLLFHRNGWLKLIQ
jgi:hypothetical protein